MPADFPLTEKATVLGPIADPIIPVAVLTKYGYQMFDFLVDTGADCSVMPASVANDLNIDLTSLPKVHFIGIEGRNVLSHIAKITIKITETPLPITCALSVNHKCPFILGRKDIFSKFNIIFDNRHKIVKFIQLPDSR